MKPASLSLAFSALAACAHARTPAQAAMIARADCKELLAAADSARAAGDTDAAADLANACPGDQLGVLVAASSPAQGLLWCGRAAAAGHKLCDQRTLSDLQGKLLPRIRIGPPDESIAIDPLLARALEKLSAELNLAWSASEPDVVLGSVKVSIDHLTNSTIATVPDAKGRSQHVPARQHRFVARASGQVALGDKTRTLRAQDEARDLTWDAAPKLLVAGKPDPQPPPEDELKERAVAAWLRVLQRALASAPPESLPVDDERGCVAYGIALNLDQNDGLAAAQGRGDEERIAACEKLLGLPSGAGIPAP